MPSDGGKVLTFGNKGLNDELLSVGLNAELFRPMLPGESDYSPSLSDSQFADYQIDE